MLSVDKDNENFWNAEILLNELLKKYKNSVRYIPDIEVHSIDKDGEIFKILSGNQSFDFSVKKSLCLFWGFRHHKLLQECRRLISFLYVIQI